MKKLLSLSLAIAFAAGYSSCKFPESNDANNIKMRDSVFATLPTVNGIKVEVKEHEDVTVIIYDKQLFNASEDKRAEAVNQLTGMTVAIYEDNNWLKTGKVIFLEKETMVDDISKEEQKTYDMNLAPLLKDDE